MAARPQTPSTRSLFMPSAMSMARLSLETIVLLTTVLLAARAANAVDLTSPSFKSNEKIPAKFTCEGQNLTRLSISEVFQPARSSLS